MFDTACLTYTTTGLMPNLDEFVFAVVDRKLQSVTYPELGVKMMRVD